MSSCARKAADVHKVIARTHAASPSERKRALKEMCPCRVLKEIPELWERIVEMVDDPSPTVRYQVMHNLCDGSPTHMEGDVIELLETRFRVDPDEKVRRRARKVLACYARTGRYNVM